MFGHYLLMGLRTIARSRAYAFTNMFGLAAGFASCLIILLFVRHELSYDSWLPEAQRTYQVQLSLSDPDSEPVHLQMAPYPAAAALARDFPQVEAAAGSFTARPVILRDGAAMLPERDALMADANFFDVVSIPFAAGNPRTALAAVDSVVLSRTEARRYFGDADPLGEVLTILHRGQRRDVRVTGLFEDLPSNSHMRFPMVFRLNPSDYADEPGLPGDWENISGFVYAKLRPGADAGAVAAALPAWARRHVPAAAGERRRDDAQVYRLTPVQDVHLGRHQTAAMTPGSDAATIATFAGVAAMILAIACFNFVNLSTARAARRAREVGVRKVLGAARRQLVAQFVTESMMIVGGAMLIALAAVELAAPAVGRFLDIDAGFSYFGEGGLWLPIAGLVLLVALLATLYPALVLARYQPGRVLKANRNVVDGGGSGRLRNLLAAAQFSVVIGFLVCTAVIYAQTQYARSAELGYQREGLIRIDNLDRASASADALVAELRRLPGVESVGRSTIAPGTGNVTVAAASLPGRTEPVSIGLYRVDDGFFRTMRTRLLAGRDFSPRHALDDSTLPATPDAPAERALATRGINVVVSALGARRLGFATPDAAVGRQISLGFIDEANGDVPATIVGVVEDVRYRSMREELGPIAYRYVREGTDRLVLRYATPEPARLLAQVRAMWQARAPEVPFEATFVEDAVARMYDADAARGHLFFASSALAILIGCLGLFGLAAFLAERRTMEIGLRKVFGARVGDIVALLVWQFSRPVLFANLIAWPVAWWVMRDWLDGFTDRIALSPAFFLGAGLLAGAIAVATVGAHAVRVARARPIEALRYE